MEKHQRKLFHSSWWWCLAVGVASRLTELFEDGEDNGRLLLARKVVLPAANVATGSDSEAQRQVTTSEPALIPGLATAVLTVLLSQPSHPRAKENIKLSEQ
ncbi:hypothetical protein L195_g020319 [Trifolium pratense]|uniref:Uncharacterized protein n=1 Tax=Trifolium pratense TaxID=57577 RepID=A0A2K3N288_TRIPR|nr:hypothetical protein L195_g020319 [Trifolium pratense]